MPLGRTPGNDHEGLSRIAVCTDSRIADEPNVRSMATLEEISVRLSEEFPAVPRADVERALLASWWLFDRETDEQLRARAAEWYTRAAFNALAERQPVERA